MFDTKDELLDKIRLGEDSFLELKTTVFRGDKLIGPDRKQLADELAAFANSKGGVLVLGVDDDDREIEGIPIDRLDQVEGVVREVLIDSITPPLDATILKLTLPDQMGEERAVVRVDVPRSLFVHQSPGGYYRRIGSSKRPIPPEALARLFQQRSQARLIRFDEQAVPGAPWSELDQDLYKRFLGEGPDEPEIRLRKLRKLRKLRILTQDDEGTTLASVAGVLMCSYTPERWLTGAKIEAVRYRGTRQDSNYQTDAESITGPADQQIRRALSFVSRTMIRRAEKVPERREFPQFSIRAVFEAIVNAVAHRDYSVHGSKIRLFVFDDRLELYSPGPLPNSLTIESLRERQSTRNELLTTLLGRIPVEWPGEERLGRGYFIEKRGDGIPIIMDESRELSGRAPEYRLIDEAELVLTIWGAELPKRESDEEEPDDQESGEPKSNR